MEIIIKTIYVADLPRITGLLVCLLLFFFFDAELTVKTLETLAIGKMVEDVGFRLIASELFITPKCACQITLLL